MSTGYNIYSNTGAGDPINYGSPVATVSPLSTTTWTSSSLASPGDWKFGVRAFNTSGEEQNLDCAVEIILDASGNDITNQPAPPLGLRAFALAAAAIRVEWFYPRTVGAKAPAGFHVYIGTGGAPSYASPVATVSATSVIAGAFVANLTGLSDGTAYSVGVRAFNATAEETNTTAVTVTADATGPNPVQSLTATAMV
jgi:hypothetical protein